MLERQYPGWQHLQHKCLEKTFFSLYKRKTCTVRTYGNFFNLFASQTNACPFQMRSRLEKSQDRVQNFVTVRHQVFESSGLTHLLLHQNTNLVVQRETRIETLALSGPRSLISAPTVRGSSWTVIELSSQHMCLSQELFTAGEHSSICSSIHSHHLNGLFPKLRINVTASTVSSANWGKSTICSAVRCCTRSRGVNLTTSTVSSNTRGIGTLKNRRCTRSRWANTTSTVYEQKQSWSERLRHTVHKTSATPR